MVNINKNLSVTFPAGLVSVEGKIDVIPTSELRNKKKKLSCESSGVKVNVRPIL